ncbi:MAG: hypothetical protein ABI137_12685 [Antricoccus sp.]
MSAVAEVRQSTAKTVRRLVSSLDQFLTHRLEVRSTTGQVLLTLTCPAKVVKPTIIVQSGRWPRS